MMAKYRKRARATSIIRASKKCQSESVCGTCRASLRGKCIRKKGKCEPCGSCLLISSTSLVTHHSSKLLTEQREQFEREPISRNNCSQLFHPAPQIQGHPPGGASSLRHLSPARPSHHGFPLTLIQAGVLRFTTSLSQPPYYASSHRARRQKIYCIRYADTHWYLRSQPPSHYRRLIRRPSDRYQSLQLSSGTRRG
jgi:hypothetical protein